MNFFFCSFFSYLTRLQFSFRLFPFLLSPVLISTSAISATSTNNKNNKDKNNIVFFSTKLKSESKKICPNNNEHKYFTVLWDSGCTRKLGVKAILKEKQVGIISRVNYVQFSRHFSSTKIFSHNYFNIFVIFTIIIIQS